MQAKTVPSGDQVAEAKRQRPRRVRHTAAQWAQIIAAQRQSPLTLVEFCRRRQIALATFRYWRQHLASPTAVALPTQRFPPCRWLRPMRCYVSDCIMWRPTARKQQIS